MQSVQKRFFPVEFYASALNFSDEKIDPKIEIYELVQDARLRNIAITPPNIKKINKNFEIIDDNTIAFGISHIRGVGSKAIESIGKISSLILLNLSSRLLRKLNVWQKA
jgi:DNA polymerase III alpha subunit